MNQQYHLARRLDVQGKSIPSLIRLVRQSTSGLLAIFLLFLLIGLQFIPYGPSSRPVLAQTSGAWSHSTVQDFNSCSALTDTSITNLSGGEIRLAAPLEDYFDGPSLDSGRWVTNVINGGYVVPPTFNDGILILDGRWISSTLPITSFPVVVEGRLRFSEPEVGTAWADVGLAKVTQIPGPPNALFISDNSGNVFANDYQPGASQPQRTLINGFDWNTFHNIRLELDTNQVDYYVDGQLVVNHALATPLTPPFHLWAYTQLANYDLAVDWLRIADYPNTGQFVSCVIDNGGQTGWDHLAWHGETPAGTSVNFETRSSVDGAAWSSWAALGSGGTILSPAGRYIQYRVNLSTTDPAQSPEVRQVVVAPAGLAPLTVTNVQGVPTSPTTAQVTWQTNRLADSRVNYGVTTGLGTVEFDAEYISNHKLIVTGLQPDTDYFFQVRSEDTAGQTAQSAISSFTTPSSLVSHSSAADFGQGSSCSVLSNTIVSDIGGGEVRLSSTMLEDYFYGTTLDTSQWVAPNGFIPTIGSGLIEVMDAVNGGRIRTINTHTPRRVAEFRASFGETTYQHIGFSNFGGQWAIFSTGTGGMGTSNIFAWSTASGDPGIVTTLPDLNLNEFYNFRLVWETDRVEFWVDGVLRATHQVSISGPLYTHATNVQGNNLPMYVDYYRLLNLPPNGTYRSCTLDVGQVVDWNTLDWMAQTPAGTGVTFRARSSLDGVNWSAWTAPITSAPSTISIPSGRFLQYEATLTTNSSELTPILESVTVSYNGALPPATPTPTSTYTPIPTPSPTYTDTPTSTFTATATPTETPTGTVQPTHTPTATPTATTEPTLTSTPTATSTVPSTPAQITTPTLTPGSNVWLPLIIVAR